jgi:diacylglycerol O-acyltransferase / wax synthase
MKKLSGQDALFLHIDRPNFGTHGSMIYIYDQEDVPAGPLRFKQILRHIEQNLDAAPFFRRKIVQVPLSLGYPYWALDDQFDINFHVRHSALPKPGDWRQFCILASRIQSRQIDLSRPPWEMHVIEGLDNIDWLPKGSFAILTKGHHAAMDGSAFAELTWALHDLEAHKGRRKPVVRKATVANLEVAPSTLSLLAHALKDNLTAPLRMAGPAAKVVPKLGSMALAKVGRMIAGERMEATKTRFNAQVSSQRVFDTAIFEFDQVRAIRAAVPGVTINDVVLAIIGGAMRKYLQGHKELPKGTLKAASPVNTRVDKGATTTEGNNISVVTFPLGTDIASPLERLAAVHEATVRTKETANAVGASELTDLSKYAPPATLAFAGRLVTLTGLGGQGPFPLHHTAVSNVPGPTVPIYLLGARMRYWSCVAPIADGMGLFHAVTSCDGKLFVSPTSTPEMLPDIAHYTQCIRDSMLEMSKAAAAAQAALPTATKSAKSKVKAPPALPRAKKPVSNKKPIATKKTAAAKTART